MDVKLVEKLAVKKAKSKVEKWVQLMATLKVVHLDDQKVQRKAAKLDY